MVQAQTLALSWCQDLPTRRWLAQLLWYSEHDWETWHSSVQRLIQQNTSPKTHNSRRKIPCFKGQQNPQDRWFISKVLKQTEREDTAVSLKVAVHTSTARCQHSLISCGLVCHGDLATGSYQHILASRWVSHKPFFPSPGSQREKHSYWLSEWCKHTTKKGFLLCLLTSNQRKRRERSKSLLGWAVCKFTFLSHSWLLIFLSRGAGVKPRALPSCQVY